MITDLAGRIGWGRSAWLERHQVDLPGPADRRLAWFVREAWPSPVTGTACTEGVLSSGESVELSVESGRLVAFGDGIESDAITLAWVQAGQRPPIRQDTAADAVTTEPADQWMTN